MVETHFFQEQLDIKNLANATFSICNYKNFISIINQ